MKKIMVIGNSSTGIYSVRKELIESLSINNKVYIVALESNRVSYFESIGCKFIKADFNSRGMNPAQELKLFMFYFQVIKKERPDVVLTFAIKPNSYAGFVCTLLGIPFIVNVTGLGTAVEYGGITQKLALLIYRIGIRNAKMVFFQNEDNLQFMLNNHVVKGKYALIPGSGVNLEHFSLLPFPENDKVEFALIARIMKEKGIDQYLEMAKVIKKLYPNTEFHVCGGADEPYLSELQRLTEKNIVNYHGRVEDMTNIYRRCQCIIHPTYYPEGMSNVLLEASASGRPMITTNRAGCREVVENGVNGFLINERDTEDLIKKVKCFLETDYETRKQMGIAARKKVEQGFSRQIVVDSYLHEINKIG